MFYIFYIGGIYNICYILNCCHTFKNEMQTFIIKGKRLKNWKTFRYVLFWTNRNYNNKKYR